MPIGEGAGYPRGDLSAVNRARHYAKGVLEHGHVEAGKVEDLKNALIGKETRELRGVVVPADLNELGITVAARQLREAKPVAIGVEPKRLGVDGDGVAEVPPRRQIASMQLYRHIRGS